MAATRTQRNYLKFLLFESNLSAGEIQKLTGMPAPNTHRFRKGTAQPREKSLHRFTSNKKAVNYYFLKKSGVPTREARNKRNANIRSIKNLSSRWNSAITHLMRIKKLSFSEAMAYTDRWPKSSPEFWQSIGSP